VRTKKKRRKKKKAKPGKTQLPLLKAHMHDDY
jgi:hypothetical protein